MADFGGFEIEDDEKKPSSPSAFGGFEIEDGDEGAPGEKTPVASAEASTPKSPAPTVASPEPEAPPAPTWESGDGGEPTLPAGEKNQWGGNLRTEGRKPLIRRDANGKVSGYSTTHSMFVRHDDGRIAVVPTVVDGKELSTKDAAKHYADTGEYWGMADNEEGAKKIARAVHDEHQKAYQEGWNEYIQSHWDDMGDEIRRDPGVRGEHARRKRDARLAEEMKAWGKDAEAIKGYRERTKTTQVAPELFLTGDLLEDADGNAIKPGDAIAVYHKEGDGPFTGEAGQAARLMEFTGVNDDGKPVFKETEGVSSEGAMLAGKLHVRDEDFDRMMGKGEGKVERSPFEQVRLGALAETGDRYRYTDDALGTVKAMYDRLMPYAGRMAPNERRERTRHLSNIYEGKLDGYDGKTEAEKYRDAARKAGLEPWNPLESLHPDENDEEFVGRIQHDAGEELRLDAIAKLDAGGKLSATEQSILDKIVKGGIESGGYALEFAFPGGAMFKGAQALNWGAKAVRAATMLGSAVPVVATEAASRYQENVTPEYGFGDNGEFKMVAAPDDEEEAAYKAIGGAIFDTAVEVGLEAVTMGLLRGAGKATGWALGKATPGAVREFGAKRFNKFMASETGQALRSINRAYQDFSAMTQINSPLGELAEENVQAFEKVIGLDGKSSEYKGLAKEWQDFKDNQLNWKTQWDIFYGLIAQLAIGSAKSASEGIAQHVSSTDARRDIRMALKRSGISDEAISMLTPEQQRTLDHMWRHYSSNPDELKAKVKNLGISMRLAADELLSRESSRMAADLKRSGIEPEEFVIQTGEDGKPAFQQMMRFGSDGSKVPMNAMTDAAHGVTIVDQGDGNFYVMNDLRGLDAIPADSFANAQTKADAEVMRNQRQERLNEIAAQRLMELMETRYAGRNVVSIPSEAALRWQVAQAVRDGKSLFGITRADQLFREDGSLRQPGAGGFHTPDGHIVVILDNVPSPAEMERVLAHEATGHDGVESATGRGAKTVEFIQNAQAEGFSRFVEGERQRAIQRRVAEGMDEAAATAQVDAAMATDEYKRESMARYAQGRLHAPTWYERRKHEANERRRRAGENVPTDQADLEVVLAEQEAHGREGDNELETLPGDSGVRYEEGATDEARNGADEAQPQPEQGEERGQEAPQPEAGAEPGAQAPDAGVVEPSKTDNGGQNLNTAPEGRPVSADTIGGKAEPKPKGKRGDNLRGRSYEDYAKHPDEGGTADVMGAELMRFARDNGGLLKMPPKDVADPMADWINAFLDGGGRKKNRGEFIALFGMKPKTGANDAIAENMPTGLKDYVEKMIERDGPGAVADWFLETRRKYREWAQGRRDAAREERLAAKDRAEEAEALESFDFDELAAARDAMDEEFANALGVVEGADEADYAALTPASLQIAKSGDTIRFDHDRKSFVFGSFDAGSGVLVVYDEDVAGMEGGKFRRAYRVTENSIEEIDDGQGNEIRADADRAGDEKGPAGGGGEAQGGGFRLESVTAEQIAAEEKKRREKAEIKKRQEAPLKGSGAVNVQPEMDLGQTGQQDLFSPIAENEETTPAAKENAAERPAEYLAWLEKYKMKDTDGHFAEWQRKQSAQKPAKNATANASYSERLDAGERITLVRDKDGDKMHIAHRTYPGTKKPVPDRSYVIHYEQANDGTMRVGVPSRRIDGADAIVAEIEGLKKLGWKEVRQTQKNTPVSAPRTDGTTTPPKSADAPRVVKTTRDGESIRIVENGREYEVELPDVKFPKTFTKATSKADWEAKMSEAKKIADELKKKAPFHSVINPKTGKYYANDSEVARQRRREVAAYEEAVRRATNQAFDEIGEYDDSWDEEPTTAAQGGTEKPANSSRANSDAEGAALTSIDEIEHQKRRSAQKVELSDEAIAEINKWIADNPNGNFADNGLRGIFDAEMERAKARNGGKVNPADVMPTLDAISVAYDSMKNNAEPPKTATARERLASVYAEWADGEALPAWADRLTDAETKEYADLIDAALSVEGDDGGKAYRAVTGFEKRHEAASPSQTRETAPASAPKKAGTTTPPKAAKPPEGGKSASGGAPKSSAPTATRATAKPAFKRGDRVFLKGAEDGQRVTFLKANADGTADVQVRTPGANRYAPEKVETRTVPMGDVSSTGMKDTLTGEERNAYRRGVAEQTREAMRSDPTLRRIDAAYRAAKTDAERAELKAQFAERVRELQGGVDFDTPGIYTGTAADYANRSRRGGVDDGPSVKHIGTGEGSQVYGWGLYGSTVRGVAEGYAKSAKRDKALTQDEDTFQAVKKVLGENVSDDILQAIYEGVTGNSDWNEVKAWIKRDAEWDDEIGPEMLSVFRKKESALKKVHEQYAAHSNLYEQTFFTDRAPGDESHLLKWYEDLPKEQVDWIAQEFAKEGFFVASFSKLKGWTILDRTSGKKMSLWDKRESGEAYEAIANFLGSPQAASEFLARAGIDGVKYPVDSYGGKGVKDGDEAGWNYVAFSDEHIRVDHKWTDGVLQFDTPELSPVTTAKDAAYMDAVRRGDTETAERMRQEAVSRAMPSTKVVDENDRPLKVYHGSRTGANIKIFNTPSFFSSDRDTADMFKKEADFILRVNGKEVAIDDITARQIADELTKGDFTPDEMADWGSFEGLIGDIEDNGNSYGGRDVIADALAGVGIDTPLDEITEMSFKRVPDIYECYVNITNPLEIDFKGRTWGQDGTREMEAAVRDAAKNGYDGVIVRNIREGGLLGELRNGEEPPLSTDYIPISPNQIKSAAPVTYDDAGNVIPLSQRFNPQNEDIRFDTPELYPDAERAYREWLGKYRLKDTPDRRKEWESKRPSDRRQEAGGRTEGESLFDGYLDELLGISGATQQNPLGQVVPPPDGSVAQAIDAEIAADEARAARGAARAQGAPPAPAPGSQGNERLDPGYEPESLGAGVKDPVSRQEIVDKFRELFSDTVAIRGKNTTRIGKYAGHYEPGAGIIRSKDPVSLRTIPHELGHHIDAVLKKHGPMRPNAVKGELIALGKKLYGSKQPAGGYQSEGFAEMVKYYLQGNEEGLKKEAPAAYSWLVNDFGKAHPDIMEKMDALRDMIDRFQNQSGDEAVRATRAKDPNFAEKIVGRLSDMIKGLKLTQENWIDTGAFITKGMRASGLDKLMDWRAALKRGDVAEMNDIIENHPVLKWKLYNGKSAARAYQALAGGLTDLSGTRRYTYGDLGMATPGHAADEKLPTFKEIFGDFTPEEMDEFENYAIARIAKEAYLDKGLEFGLTKSEIAPTLAKHARNTKFRDALERYTHYKHGVLHLLVDAGAMSQEQFEEIVKANPIYVKIARRRESADLFRDRMLKKRGKAVNRRTGSGRQVEDIFDAGLVDDERVFSAAFQADLLRSLVNLGERGEANNAAPGGALQGELSVGANWIHEVSNAQGAVRFTAEQLRKQITDAMRGAAMAPDKAAADNLFDQLFSDGEDILTVFKQKPSEGKNGLVSLYDEDGALHTYELPENNAEGWAKGLFGFTDSKRPNILVWWFQIAAAATRTGATILNPTFALRNIVRDTLHASTVNEFGFMIPGASTVQGIAMDMMGSNAKEIFDAMGIPMGSMLGESRLQSARRANRYLMSRNWFEAQWNKGVKKAIADFVGFSENGTRIKEFKLVRDYMLSHGASEKAADMLAGANALDITIDFQRGGEVAKGINRFIPFFNAGIQGLEQTARAFGLLRAKEWQLETDRKRRAGRTVLQGAAWLLMLSLLAELFNRSDDDRKRKIDELKPHERWNYISFGDVRLPVPYEIGYIFSSIPRAVIAELYDGQKGAVAECLGMFRQTLPGISPTDIAFAGPLLNTAMNEYWHGGIIVPEYVQKSKLSYDWYDERTSEFSKMLGKAMYKVFGQGKISSPAHIDAFMNGITGNMYGRTLGAIGGQAELDASRPNTWPVVGTFFRNNLTANRLVGEFYERKIELERKKGSGVATDGELAELHNAEKLAKRFAELRKESQKAKEDKSLSVTERNDRLEKIVLEMQQGVRDYNKDPSGGDETAYEIEVRAFEKANGEYKKAMNDKSVPKSEREKRLSGIREGNPLMRDDVREKISAHVKRLKGWESKAKKAQKTGKSSAEIDANIEKEKENILDMIRAARK